jgi:hypothetical protein
MPTMPPRTPATRRHDDATTGVTPDTTTGVTTGARNLPAGHLAVRAVAATTVFAAMVSLLVTAFEVGR